MHPAFFKYKQMITLSMLVKKDALETELGLLCICLMTKKYKSITITKDQPLYFPENVKLQLLHLIYE